MICRFTLATTRLSRLISWWCCSSGTSGVRAEELDDCPNRCRAETLNQAASSTWCFTQHFPRDITLPNRNICRACPVDLPHITVHATANAPVTAFEASLITRTDCFDHYKAPLLYHCNIDVDRKCVPASLRVTGLTTSQVQGA